MVRKLVARRKSKHGALAVKPVVFSLVHAVAGICSFLLDGHVFPSPSLNFLMRLLPPPMLQRFIHCCGMAEVICAITQYFLPMQFEQELYQFVQKTKSRGIFRLAQPVSSYEMSALEGMEESRARRWSMGFLA